MTRWQQVALLMTAMLAVGAGVLAPRLLESDDRPRQTATDRPAAEQRLFSPTSVWNKPLAEDEPLDPASDSLTAAFAAQVAREQRQRIGPWIATDDTSTPIYRVGPKQRRTPVKLQTGPWGATLKAALARGVPIPDDARPAKGPDRHMTVYQPATDTMWEFWRARRQAGGWTAEWGGVMRRVSKSPGYYTRDSFPGSGRNWGSTATSLPVAAGTITISEFRRGRIDHALALNVRDARKGVFSWPAQRSDGDGGPSTLPEGARLRLDPALDVDALKLNPAGRTLALAAQRHGMIVRDVTHHATSLFAEDPTPTGSDPYPRIFGGSPADALENFPWDRLQLLQMTLCRRAPCEPREGGR